MKAHIGERFFAPAILQFGQRAQIQSLRARFERGQMWQHDVSRIVFVVG